MSIDAPAVVEAEVTKKTTPSRQKEASSPRTEQTKELTLDKAKTLFFLSFRFSQGDQMLQSLLFSYIHALHPDWRISNTFKREIAEEVRGPIEKFLKIRGGKYDSESRQHLATVPSRKRMFFFPRDISQGFIDRETVSQLDTMQQAFNPTLEEPVDIPRITEMMITNDHRYLVKMKGRARTPAKDKRNANTDPYLSQIVHLGIERNPTGAEEYDRLFQEIGALLNEEGTSRLWIRSKRQLQKVFKVHNEHHATKYYLTKDELITQDPSLAAQSRWQRAMRHVSRIPVLAKR